MLGLHLALINKSTTIHASLIVIQYNAEIIEQGDDSLLIL
jgi:hypothetical protein